MIKREYPGYPQVVIPSLPKLGNETLTKCFRDLGYKVFGVSQVPEFSHAFDDYGTGKIEFAKMAKTVWEDNEYDVVIAFSGLCFKEMSERWPEAKFINLVRDPEDWAETLKVQVSIKEHISP